MPIILQAPTECMYSAKMRVFRVFSNREMGRPHSMVCAG